MGMKEIGRKELMPWLRGNELSKGVFYVEQTPVHLRTVSVSKYVTDCVFAAQT